MFGLSRRCVLALLALMVMQPGAPALAQNYPSKPVTIIVPLAAGTGMDTVVRLYGEKLQAVDRFEFVDQLGPADSTADESHPDLPVERGSPQFSSLSGERENSGRARCGNEIPTICCHRHYGIISAHATLDG